MKRDFFRFFKAKERTEDRTGNPLFPEPKKAKWRSWAIRIAGAVLLGGGLSLLYYFATLPRFYITTVSVNGLVAVDEAQFIADANKELHKPALLFFDHAHILFFKADDLQKSLEDTYPLTINEVKRNGQTVEITVTEDLTMLAFYIGNTVYLGSLEGTIIREMTTDERQLVLSGVDDPTNPIPYSRLPHVYLNAVSADLQLNTEILDPNVTKNIVDLQDRLRILGLTMDNISFMNGDASWGTLKTKEKPYLIMLDLTQSLDEQLTMLKTTLENNESDITSYIDIRFGNHVYIK